MGHRIPGMRIIEHLRLRNARPVGNIEEAMFLSVLLISKNSQRIRRTSNSPNHIQRLTSKEERPFSVPFHFEQPDLPSRTIHR